jgi:hypothetical protein
VVGVWEAGVAGTGVIEKDKCTGQMYVCHVQQCQRHQCIFTHFQDLGWRHPPPWVTTVVE